MKIEVSDGSNIRVYTDALSDDPLKEVEDLSKLFEKTTKTSDMQITYTDLSDRKWSYPKDNTINPIEGAIISVAKAIENKYLSSLSDLKLKFINSAFFKFFCWVTGYKSTAQKIHEVVEKLIKSAYPIPMDVIEKVFSKLPIENIVKLERVDKLFKQAGMSVIQERANSILGREEIEPRELFKEVKKVFPKLGVEDVIQKLKDGDVALRHEAMIKSPVLADYIYRTMDSLPPGACKDLYEDLPLHLNVHMGVPTDKIFLRLKRDPLRDENALTLEGLLDRRDDHFNAILKQTNTYSKENMERHPEIVRKLFEINKEKVLEMSPAWIINSELLDTILQYCTPEELFNSLKSPVIKTKWVVLNAHKLKNQGFTLPEKLFLNRNHYQGKISLLDTYTARQLLDAIDLGATVDPQVMINELHRFRDVSLLQDKDTCKFFVKIYNPSLHKRALVEFFKEFRSSYNVIQFLISFDIDLRILLETGYSMAALVNNGLDPNTTYVISEKPLLQVAIENKDDRAVHALLVANCKITPFLQKVAEEHNNRAVLNEIIRRKKR